MAAAASAALVQAPAGCLLESAGIWRTPLTFERVPLGNGGALFVSAQSTLRISSEGSADRGRRGNAPDLCAAFDPSCCTVAAHPPCQHKSINSQFLE